MKQIPLNLLNVFMESARCQSFKMAGERLLLSTSAVSQSIKKLEDLSGVLLFYRTPNSVELTPAGQEFFAYVETGLKEIERGIQHLNEKKRTITLFCPPGFATFLVQPLISQILSAGYEDIHMISRETLAPADYDRYDIAVLLDEAGANISKSTFLGPDYFQPFCHHSLFEKISAPADIFNYLLLCNEHGRTSWKEWLDLNGLVGAEAKTMTVSRASQLLSAVESGVGIGLESSRVLAPKLASGDYKVLSLKDTKPIIKALTWLVVHPKRAADKKINAIAKLIYNSCSTDADGRLKSPVKAS
ncbi:LysR family transcriptional regulator [Bartonella sp. LJL80]